MTKEPELPGAETGVDELVRHIGCCDIWLAKAYEGFNLQNVILEDMASMSHQGDPDLRSVAYLFSEAAKERLFAPGGKWSWRSRASIQGYRSEYLDWLRDQWVAGRWKDDVAIHPNARHFLDPRVARFESLAYSSDANNRFKMVWPEIVRRYREIAGKDALLRGSDLMPVLGRVSKGGVEEYVLQYFESAGWECYSSRSKIGNILTIERALPLSEYVFRLSMSLADRGLLDHVDCWISVTPSNSDMHMMNGGAAALVSANLGGLLLPASTYYLTHDGERQRIVGAVAFIDSSIRAMYRS